MDQSIPDTLISPKLGHLEKLLERLIVDAKTGNDWEKMEATGILLRLKDVNRSTRQFIASAFGGIRPLQEIRYRFYLLTQIQSRSLDLLPPPNTDFFVNKSFIMDQFAGTLYLLIRNSRSLLRGWSIRSFTPKGTDISAKWNGGIHGARSRNISGLALNAAGTLLAVEYTDDGMSEWTRGHHINIFQTSDQTLRMGFDSGVTYTIAMVFGNNNDLYIIQQIIGQATIHIWDVGGDAPIPRPMETISDDIIDYTHSKFIFDLDTRQRYLVVNLHFNKDLYVASLYNLDTQTLTNRWPEFPKPVLDIAYDTFHRKFLFLTRGNLETSDDIIRGKIPGDSISVPRLPSENCCRPHHTLLVGGMGALCAIPDENLYGTTHRRINILVHDWKLPISLAA
jgi:hypothetical protein